MKRILALIMSVVLLISCVLYVSAYNVVGDANSDGMINLSDCSVMLKYIAGWEGLRIDLEASDVTKDGRITLSDVTTILRYLPG